MLNILYIIIIIEELFIMFKLNIIIIYFIEIMEEEKYDYLKEKDDSIEWNRKEYRVVMSILF